jgi:cytochrome c oxidase subunit 4
MNTGHILPIRLYLFVFGSLLFLTALTVAAALVDLGLMNTVVAITIAVVKGLLVVLFFMHLRYSERLNWIFAGAAFFWLAILLGLTVSDYISRGW